MKLDERGVAVRFVEEPEAIRDWNAGLEVQVQRFVADYMKEHIGPRRRRDGEAGEVCAADGDVSRASILGDEVGEYEHSTLGDGPGLLIIRLNTAIKIDKATPGGGGDRWTGHISLS